MKYGYARTSTGDQTTALQLAALQGAECSKIFEDKGKSGATVKRPALARCLKALRPGDTLIVWKLDRLGRSLRDLIATARRTPGTRRVLSVADRGDRHRDAHGARHVADDRSPGRAGAQPDRRAHPRRA